jgi:hypothetical protein
MAQSGRRQLEFRSDAKLNRMARKALTSDRLLVMIPTGGQTEAVRPGSIGSLFAVNVFIFDF